MRNQNNVLFQVVNGLITLFWTVLFTLFTVMAHASPEFTVLPCISGVALYSGGDGDTGLWLYDNPSWVREGDVYAEGFLSFRDNPNVLGNVIVGGSATNQSEFWEGTVRGTVTIGLAQHTPHFVNRPSLCADVPAGKDCLVTAGTYTGIPIGSPNTNGRAIVTNSGIPYTACDVPRYSGDTDSGVTPFSSWSPPASETLFQWKNSTQMDLNPGFYGRVRIRQSNNLTINLYSGTYYLDDLFLEECTGIHFKVNVNAAGEPVYLLLKNGIKFTSNSMWGIPNLPSFPIPSSSLITWNQNGDASNIIIYAENGDFISPSHPYESSYTILNAIVVAANGNIRLIDGNGNGINGSFLASKELVYYQYSLGELRSLSAGGKCPAPIDEIGGIAFSQENDVTPRNFIVGEVNDHWLLVQSTYDNTKGNWGGSLQAHPLALGSNSNTNSNTNAGPTTPAPTAWSDTAEARLANRVGRGAAGGAQNARLIKTSLPNGTSVAWSSSQLSTVQKQQILDKKPLFSSFSGTDDEFVEQLIRYHLGEASAESSSDFKNRDNIFGDSVFCEPKLLGPSLVRLKTYQNGSETPHVAFREQTQNRTPYVVTCGNDGVLRFTDLATGEETFAYILQNAIGKLPITAHRDEVHEYTLDGAITIGDAFIHQAWTTVGVVTCGVGGNCLAAVDLGYDTVLDDSHSPRVLWELNQDDIAGADLNLTLADASIVRIQDPQSSANNPRYRWVAIFGNGFPKVDADQKATLIMVDLEDKTKQWIVHTVAPSDQPNDGRGNGLGTPNVLDLNADGTADVAIACDRFGQCWYFDLMHITAAPTLLFATADHQPVWTRPAIDRIDHNTIQVYVGSGQYLTESDHFDFNSITQHFYAVKVNTDSPRTVQLGTLNHIMMDKQGTVSIQGEQANYRVLKRVNTDERANGWYLSLPEEGERVISHPALLGDQIFFSSVIPDNYGGACTGKATGWLMFLDKRLGLQSPQPTLDLNGDGVFDGADKVTVAGAGAVSPAGISFDQATISVPQVVSHPGSWDKTDAFVSRSDASGSSALGIGFRLVAPSTRKNLNVVQ